MQIGLRKGEKDNENTKQRTTEYCKRRIYSSQLQKKGDCYEVIDDHNGNVLAVVTTFKEAKKIAEQYDMFPMYVSYRELDLLRATGSIFGKK